MIHAKLYILEIAKTWNKLMHTRIKRKNLKLKLTGQLRRYHPRRSDYKPSTNHLLLLGPSAAKPRHQNIREKINYCYFNQKNY